MEFSLYSVITLEVGLLINLNDISNSFVRNGKKSKDYINLKNQFLYILYCSYNAIKQHTFVSNKHVYFDFQVIIDLIIICDKNIKFKEHITPGNRVNIWIVDPKIRRICQVWKQTQNEFKFAITDTVVNPKYHVYYDI